MSEIHFEYDQKSLSALNQFFMQFDNHAKNALRSAINTTATTARKDLANEAKATYDLKRKSFNADMTIKRATQANLEADIKSKGESLQMTDFKVSPAAPSNGASRPSYVKGRVLLQSALKNLTLDGRKAFVLTARNGHVAVVARTVDYESPEDRRNHHRHTHTFYSPSVPSMLGYEERVYGKVEPIINKNLKENVEAQIQKYL